MEYDSNDNNVIHLLRKLKDSNGAYPPEMLAVRRQGYIKQVAEISGGAGLAMGLKNLAKGGKESAGFSSTAGTIVEALLVVALVAEAGAVTFFYRDKIAQYFQSSTHSPKVEEIASPPILSSPIAEMPITPSPVFTFTVTEAGTETLTPGPVTPSGTPSPVLAAETTGPNETGSVGVQSASTSAPGSNTGGSSVSPQDPNGNNGNHYGQTPKPERTKESSGNSDSSSSQESTSNNKKP